MTQPTTPEPQMDSVPAQTPKPDSLVDVSGDRREWWRRRPYNGQPHTDAGERGKTLVTGLTMRDIGDCLDRAFALSTGHVNPDQYEIANKGGLDYSLYSLDLSDFDPGAVGQNLTCEIERMMGIFPNVPEVVETLPSQESTKLAGDTDVRTS